MSFSRAKKSRSFLDEAALYEYALRLLGQQMRSVAELRRKLLGRVEPEESGNAKVEAVLARLREYRLVDDAAFADNFVQMRQQNQKLGPRRVRNDLAMKGVSQQLAAETIDARYAEVSEETLARQHLERKRIRKPENEKETARVMRRLVTAGFSTGVIYKVLRQWEIPEESLSALADVDADLPTEID
jgi:regulatory protein